MFLKLIRYTALRSGMQAYSTFLGSDPLPVNTVMNSCLDIEHPRWCINHTCMFIQVFSCTQQVILHTLIGY
jgi:hypothetical protein